MAMFAFRRMREQNEAAAKSGFTCSNSKKATDTEKPKTKPKPKKVKLNGDNS